MAEKDLAEKYLESYNDVFADIVNVLLFEGEEVVKPDELTGCGEQGSYKADGRVREQNRDIAKKWVKEGIVFSFIGFENQTKAEKDMPLRCVGYDGAQYRVQYKECIKDENDKNVYLEHYPVVTIVLYFGETRWTYPRNLKSCFRVDERLDKYVSDYQMNLFEIAFLSEETVNMFKSDFGIVANYFVQKRLGKRDFSKKEIDHVDALMTMMNVMTGDKRFEEILNKPEARKGGVTMCELLDKLIGEGETKGIAQGIEQGIAQGIAQGMAQGMAQGIAQGIEQGINIGEDRLAKLISILMEKGEMDTVNLVLADKKIREKYLEKYHIE